jgi:hypothetical protein
MDRGMIECEVEWNNANRKILKYLENDLSECHLSTTNPTWTSLGLNLGLCGKRLESNQLNDGMAVGLAGIGIAGINSNFVSQY